MITPNQAALMRRAMRPRPGVDWPVNAFITTKGTEHDADWAELVRLGLASVRAVMLGTEGTYNLYKVSEAGKKALEV